MERDRSYWCCVKEWSQSECVFLFTCRFIGVEGGRPDKWVFTCLGERGPAC